MGSYHGPKVRLSRSRSVPIAETDKHVSPKKDRRPGQHGYRRTRLSLYGAQLNEKQKISGYYNVRNKQMRLYMSRAQSTKGSTPEILQKTLESRLDNVVRRLRWARTIWQARQMVSHGHFLVNGRKADIASLCVKPGDVISVKPRSKAFIKRCAESTEAMGFRVPEWLSVEEEKLEARVLYLPSLEEVRIPFDIDYTKIIEFYTR